MGYGAENVLRLVPHGNHTRPGHAVVSGTQGGIEHTLAKLGKKIERHNPWKYAQTHT